MRLKIMMLALLMFPVGGFAAVPATARLDVQNMTCSLCSVTVRKTLEQVAGVQSVVVEGKAHTATITYDPSKTSPDTLTKATGNAGYPSTVVK